MQIKRWVERDQVRQTDLLSDLGRGNGVSRAWRLLRGNRFLAILQSTLSLLIGLTEAAILTLFARIALVSVESGTDRIAVPVIGNTSMTITLLALALLIFGRLAIGAIIALSVGQLQFGLSTTLRFQIVNAYSKASWRSQSNLDEGGLQQLVVLLPGKAGGTLSGLIKDSGDLLIMAAMLTYALFSDPILTLVLILAILASSFAFLPLRRWIKTRSTQVIDAQRELSTATSELSAMKFEVQVFGIGPKMSEVLGDSILKVGRITRGLSTVKSMVVPLYSTMIFSAVAVGLFALQGTTNDGLDQVGPILLVVLRSLQYGQSVQQVSIGLASLMPILTALRDEVGLLDSQRVAWGTKSLAVFDRLALEGVSYAYSEADGPVVSDVSLTMNRGERIGIVGPSGSGKSTLIRLILGLVPADVGRVLVNQSLIHEHDRGSLNRRIGVVPQLAHVFRGSLSDNLRLYRDGVTDEDLWWALEVADFAEDVRVMPRALDTEIGPGARTLSGGQQQRLAIARAFATRPDLVVMDEPTSSIDAMSEAAVSDAIERLPKDVTVVIVSHRMRILRGCDRLIVVEGGRITANGPPQEVLGSSQYLVAALEA